jgi:plastocyanin
VNKKAVIAVVVVAIVAIGAGVATYMLMSKNNTEKEPEITAPKDETQQTTSNDANSDAKVDVVFTDNGFEKDKYTVKSGETLLIKNDSSDTLQFSSDDHPTHRLNGELNAPAIGPGETTELTPEKVGTYGIHDHIHSQFTTVVEVTE